MPKPYLGMSPATTKRLKLYGDFYKLRWPDTRRRVGFLDVARGVLSLGVAFMIYYWWVRGVGDRVKNEYGEYYYAANLVLCVPMESGSRSRRRELILWTCVVFSDVVRRGSSVTKISGRAP